MLTLEDCVALCGLDAAEVHAIAEHERIPEIVAAELADYLMHSPDGELRIKAMIRDDLASACRCGDRARELALKQMLREFVLSHPHCEERHRRMLHRSERRARDQASH